jgi:hypothetical protein
MNRRGFFSFFAAPVAAAAVAHETLASPKADAVTVDIKIGNIGEQIAELQKLDDYLSIVATRSSFLAQETRSLTEALRDGRVSLDEYEARFTRLTQMKVFRPNGGAA